MDLYGNQFVWVPVERELNIYPSYQSGLTQYMTNYHEPSLINYQYEDEQGEYELMKQSVEENNGFYVARYEAGRELTDGIETVVSKKGVSVWYGIKWGESMTQIGTEGAVARAQGMYTDKTKYEVTSTLIYGSQWDAIMAWIDPAYATSNCAENSYVRNSTEKGNYGDNNTRICGSSDSYRVKNIYDLAGNVWKWTMEGNASYGRTERGGSYGYDGNYCPASNRNSNPSSISSINNNTRL